MIKKLIGKRALPIILAFTVAVTVMPTKPVFAQEEAPVILEEENIATEPEAEVLQIEDEEEPTAPDTETIELNEAQTGDALYGGEVVCRDITAQVTNDAVEDSIHTLTIHIASTNSENSVSVSARDPGRMPAGRTLP